MTDLTPTIVGSSPGWFQAGAILLGILSSVLIAVWSANKRNSGQRDVNRRNLTFQTLMSQLWDNDYITQRQIFIEVRDTEGHEALEAAGQKENEASQNTVALRSILNDYELMAVGINLGVLEEELVRRYLISTALKDFERTKTYIKAVRKRNPQAYTEFESLCERWRRISKMDM